MIIESVNRIENSVIKFIKYQPSIAISIIVIASQLLLAILLGGKAPIDKSMSELVSWEINSLRFLFLPAVIALYIKSAIYIAISTRNANNETSKENASLSVIAVLVALAFDNIIFAIVPAALNFTICLAVFQRSLVIFSVTAIVCTLFTLVFLRFASNLFAFVPLLFISYIGAEFYVTRLGFLLRDWYFLNDIFIWNLFFPSIKSPMMGDLDAPQLYEFVFFALLATTVGVMLIGLIYRKRTA